MPTDEAPQFPMKRTAPLDPPSTYSELRKEAPVCPVRLWDGSHAYAVTRYDDVRRVLDDHERFSSEHRPGFPTLGPAIAALAEKTFLKMDPPEHTQYRRMLAGEFTVRRMERFRPEIARLANGVIDRFAQMTPPVDLVETFAEPIPSLATCTMIGAPFEDSELFQRSLRVRTTLTSSYEDSAAATRRLIQYLEDLVAKKEKEPGEDILSVLVDERLRTGELDRQELASMALLLLMGGHETTANMISLGVLSLLHHPDQAEELRRRPELVGNAVEELLRYLTVSHLAPRRVTTADVEVGGVTIPAGSGVFPLIASANRDEEEFPDADHVDITRKCRHHLAFGYGVHQCIGQAFARMELQEAIGALFRRIPTLRLAADIDDLQFKEDMFVYGVYSLPVTWDAVE